MIYDLDLDALNTQMGALKTLAGHDVWLLDEKGAALFGARSEAPGLCAHCGAERLPMCLSLLSHDGTSGRARCLGGRTFLCAALSSCSASLALGPADGQWQGRLTACAALLEAQALYLSERRCVVMRDDLFGRLTAYVHAHIADDLSARALKAVLFVSAGTLNKAVREQTGLSLSNYIQRCRVESSITLLIHSSLSITEIADRSGVSDFSYFARIFKKWYGVSPREYRRTHAAHAKPIPHGHVLR